MEPERTVERRRHKRVDARLKVQITWAEQGTVVGRTHNVSRGGILVSVSFDDAPPEGTCLTVYMAHPDGKTEPHPVSTRVVRRVRRREGKRVADGLALVFLSA